MWHNIDDKKMELIESAIRFQIGEIQRVGAGYEKSASEPPKSLEERIKALQAVLDGFATTRADFDENDPYRAAAKEQADDELEVDEDAVVSPGDDPGCWVQVWIWIKDHEAGLFTCEECSGVFTLDQGDGYDVCDECVKKEDDDACRDCGETYEDGGDGYNGRCPDCADKAEKEGKSDD
jgi:DNA-directed RNA polymerase subunit RPC12/RpoP